MKIITLISLSALLFSCTEATKNQGRSGGPNGERGTSEPDRRTVIVELGELLSSHISRDRGATQLNYNQANNLFKNGDINSSLDYRAVPIDSRDNTDMAAEASRPTNDCGIDSNLAGIQQRITDCSNRNKTTHTWSGEANGIAGEGDWSLVSVNNSSSTYIWVDKRTNLLWSHSLGRADWIDASGNNNANFPCEDIDTIPSDQVTWRLPTRNEFLQADINGYPQVFALENQPDEFYWTATSAANIQNSWTIKVSTGELRETSKANSSIAVKCVGQILK